MDRKKIREDWYRYVDDSTGDDNKLEHRTVIDMFDFIIVMMDEIEKTKIEYDLKTKSDENGYISVMSWLGRVKPNTVYKVYVEEK